MSAEEPVDHDCLRAPRPPTLDGTGSDEVWSVAPRSPRFVDMATGRPGLFDTRAALLWDDDALYVAFWAEDPFPAAELRERDDIVFTETDVEVFVAGQDCYYELEVNAAGTIYEVLFVWRDAYLPGSRFVDAPELDVHRPDAFTFAGDDDRTGRTFWRGSHPRGTRWAFTGWDLPGLRVAVAVDGTLNDPSVVSRGWTAELVLPWEGLRLVAGDRPVPPRPGDVWSLFLGRFQKLVLGGREVEPHPAWCWTPHGLADTHRPERWTRIRFDERVASAAVVG
ncbi:hypothetical protein BH23CHL8_BH23CHL8_02720 [soil metagenome]